MAWLRAHRDALWAQALALYRAKEPWWIDEGSEVEKLLVSRHEAHRELDPLEEEAIAVVDKHREKGGATSDEILAAIFGFDTRAYAGRRDLYQRVAAILRPRGYLYRRWTDGGEKDTRMRWRHESWPALARDGTKAGATVTRLAAKKRKF